MKRTILTLATYLTLTLPVSAKAVSQITTTIESNGPVRQEIEQRIEERAEAKQTEMLLKREEIRNRIETKKATQAAKLQLMQKERIRSYYSRLSTRIHAYIDRLQTLLDRIQVRINSIEQDNEVDLSDIQAELDKAQELLNDSIAEIKVLDENLEEILDSENPKYEFGIFIKEGIVSIKTNLLEIHSILVHTIGQVQGLRIGNYEK